MPCLHRFLNLHNEDFGGLFPNWKVKYLFIGTFNPSWDRPDGNNADYFYGRSPYFWEVLPRFVSQDDLTESNASQKIEFCQNKNIGFTDLIKRIDNVELHNEEDRNRILSFKDSDLLTFGNNVVFNTAEIINYINDNTSVKKVYFTLLGAKVGAITAAMVEIEEHCEHLHNEFHREIEVHRLHTPTGQGLGAGAPREDVLTHRWFGQHLSFDNGFNPGEFLFL